MTRSRALSPFVTLVIAGMVMSLAPATFAGRTEAVQLPDLESTAAAHCFEFASGTPFRLSVGKYPMQIRLGDFNEDGTKDFAVADPSAHQVWIGIGLSDGTFGAPTGYPQNSAWMLAIADFNRDGHQDLAVPNREFAGRTTGGVSILLGTGQGTFTAGTVIEVSTTVPTLAAGDFNRDGSTDLALCEGSGKVEIFLNQGDGTFRVGNNYGAGTNLYNPAVGDFNNDGRPDIAVPGYWGTLAVLKATGDGTFAPTLIQVSDNPVNVAIGDFNADGRQDLVIAKYDSTSVSVLLGDGNGSFGAEIESWAGWNAREVAVGDLNGDGSQDLAVANYGERYISILIGRGDGSFDIRVNFDVGTASGSPSLALHDFNRDGRQDVVVTSADWPDRVHMVSILFNFCRPVIDVVSPQGGTVEGGQSVTIIGRNFDGATSVLFGGRSAAFTLYGDSLIRATTPPHEAGVVDLAVTTHEGIGTRTGAYTFTHPPEVSDQAFSVREDAAHGSPVGTVEASDPDSETELRFSLSGVGSERFTIGWSTGVIRVVSKLDFEAAPAYTLKVNVSDGFATDSANVTITVLDVVEPPVLNAVTPTFGPAGGGRKVMVTGANLFDAISVTFGGSPAVIGARTGNSLAVTTPVHAAGLVDVVVTTPSGSSTLSRAYNYTETSPSTCVNLRAAGVYPFAHPSSVAVADFNGDGRQDVALASNYGDITAMLAGPDGALTTSWTWNGWYEPVTAFVVTLDLNRDGKQDLLASSDFQWVAFLGNGSGAFSETTNEYWNVAGFPLPGEFDGDGISDVLFFDVAMWGEAFLRTGMGGGSFGLVQTGIYAWSYDPVAAADFNGDGLLDLALLRSGAVEPYLGVGGGSFQALTPPDVAPHPGQLAAADLNGDGLDDLVTSHAGSSQVSVNLSAGQGAFTLDTFAAASPGALTIADFSNDGVPDLAIANGTSQSVEIYSGDGTGKFAAPVSVQTDANASRIVGGDFTGDGRYDLLVLDEVAGRVKVFTTSCGPLLTGFNPVAGSARGGQTVTITGSGVEGATSVTFGGAAATIVATTPTTIAVVTPAHAFGMVDVVVTTPTGTATAANAYRFDAPPLVDESTFEVTPGPVAVNASASAVVEFADPDGSGVTHTAAIDWGDGTTDSPAVTEPSGTTAGRLAASHTYATTGVYTVKAQVSDTFDSGTAFFRYAIVVDPNGGFVTGGGTIDSPAGAYRPDPALTGKATFSFTMKYLKNQAAPQGEAEFHFQSASMKFKSTANDWMVVAGSKAQFRVTGRINGSGSYGCLMTAVSGGGSGPDGLRIRIWDQSSGAVLYDNMPGSPDDLSIVPRPLGGGSITVH